MGFRHGGAEESAAIDIRVCAVDARRHPSPGNPIKDNFHVVLRAAPVGRLLARHRPRDRDETLARPRLKG